MTIWIVDRNKCSPHSFDDFIISRWPKPCDSWGFYRNYGANCCCVGGYAATSRCILVSVTALLWIFLSLVPKSVNVVSWGWCFGGLGGWGCTGGGGFALVPNGVKAPLGSAVGSGRDRGLPQRWHWQPSRRPPSQGCVQIKNISVKMAKEALRKAYLISTTQGELAVARIKRTKLGSVASHFSGTSVAAIRLKETRRWLCIC